MTQHGSSSKTHRGTTDIRVEWARIRSRAHQWREQVDKVVAEMECVAVSHARTARRWLDRAEEVSTWTIRPDESRTHWPANALKEAQALARAEAASSETDASNDGYSALSRPSYARDIVRGLTAYAHRQSDTWLGLGATCVRTWAAFLHASKRDVRWPSEYTGVAERAVGVVEEDVTPSAEAGRTPAADEASGMFVYL